MDRAEGILSIVKQHKLVVALSGATAVVLIAVLAIFVGGSEGGKEQTSGTAGTSGTSTSDPQPEDGGAGGSTPGSRSQGTISAPSAGGAPADVPVDKIPNWGMRTQGVTDNVVKFGISYNEAACGDAAFLETLVNEAVLGDPARSIDAFERYINDTGGIAGRKLDVITFDDGGAGCPEKNVAAAEQMANEEKVFFAAPGLHVVSDYLAARKIPIFGGREDPASMAKIAPNGLQILSPLDPTFDAWASFGRHYLDTREHKACLIRPESGASGDWNRYSPLLHAKMRKHGLKFTDEIVYQEDVSTAQQQGAAITARAKGKGCDQAWFLAGNPLALLFMTNAAQQGQWHPTWTWTSYTIQIDDDEIGALMHPDQWERSIGLSIRVPIGQHKDEGKCKRIYERYYDDGGGDAAFVDLACATILPSAEMMRRAVKRTGVLTGDSLFLGADAIRNDFFFDSHVPMEYSIRSLDGPFKTRGFSHWTVAKWSRDQSRYTFPEYPRYWRLFRSGRGGSEDLRRYWAK